MTPKRHFALLLAIVSLTFVLGCERQPVPQSTPDIDVAFELTDESGNAVTSERYSGRLRLVFFGFASCPDICPMTLFNVASALRSLGAKAQDVTVLFISIDPKRDTPDKLRHYTDAFHPSIIGLTGTYEQLAAVTQGFRTTFGYTAVSGDGPELPLSREEYESLPPDAEYTPFHSAQVYLLGADDRLLDLIGYGAEAPLIEEKIRAHFD